MAYVATRLINVGKVQLKRPLLTTAAQVTTQRSSRTATTPENGLIKLDFNQFVYAAAKTR